MNKRKHNRVRENQKLTHSSTIGAGNVKKDMIALATANCFVAASLAAKQTGIQEAKQKAGMLDLGFRFHTAAERRGNSCTQFTDAKHQRQADRELKKWAKLAADGKARLVNGFWEIIPPNQRIEIGLRPVAIVFDDLQAA